MIVFSPLLPAWLAILVLLAAFVATARAYRHGGWPLLPRCLALLILAVMLFNPVRERQDTAREPPRLALVLDASASMARQDVPGGRLDQARQALERAGSAAGPLWRTESLHLRERLAPGHPDSATGGTAFDDLALLAGQARPPAAILLASDGCDRGLREPDAALAAAGIPVYCLAVGGPAPGANVTLRLDSASPTAFPGQELELVADLTATPGLAGRQTELTWEGPEGTKRETITLQPELRLTRNVAVGDAPGQRLWRVHLAPLPEEASAEDNASACAVQVVDRRIRLCVLEGRPNWDSAFAVRAWRRDRQISAIARYRVGDHTLVAGTSATGGVPAQDFTPAALADADVVVLGASAGRLVDQAGSEAIAAFVARGGGLLMLSPVEDDGDEASPPALAALDPLLIRRGNPSALCPAIAPAGRRFALLPEGVLAGATVQVRPLAGLRAGTEVLLAAGDQPVAVLRRHGSGLVAALAAEGWWRISLMGGGDERRLAVERLWRQLAKAVVADPSPLRADRARYRAGQRALVAVQGEAPLTLAGPGQPTTPMQATRGELAVELDRPGVWQLASGADRLALVVDPDVRELTNDALSQERLARLAAATGGEPLRPEAASALGERLARRADLQVAAPLRDPLALMPWWLTLLAALLGGEWFLRRRIYGTV